MAGVGTNIGTTYSGQQGTGFATILNPDMSVDTAVAKMKADQESARKQKIAASHAKMSEKDPDYWHRHKQEISQLHDGWMDLGGQMIANGEDPYSSSSDVAIDFRKLGNKIETYSMASNQLKDEWKALQSAYTDPKKRQEVENWDEIVEFYDNPSVIDIVDNRKRAPQPKFKSPEIDTYKMQSDLVKQWQGNNKSKVLSMDDAITLAAELQLNDTYSSGFGSPDAKMRQRYKAVESDPDLKEAYEARGMRNGGIDGYTQFVAESLYGMTDPVKSLDDFTLDLSKKIQTSSSTVEDGAVTKSSTYSKHSDKELRGMVKSMLIGKDGYIERDVAAGKYGDPDKLLDKNIKAAEDYYLNQLKDNIKTSFSKTEDEGKAAGEEAKSARKYWDEAIQGLHGEEEKRRAGDFLRSTLQNKDKDYIKSVIPEAYALPEVNDGIMVGPVDKSGITLEVDDDIDGKKTINIPMGGTTSEDRLQWYDKAVKGRGKVFEPKNPSAIDDLYNEDTTESLYD